MHRASKWCEYNNDPFIHTNPSKSHSLRAEVCTVPTNKARSSMPDNTDTSLLLCLSSTCYFFECKPGAALLLDGSKKGYRHLPCLHFTDEKKDSNGEKKEVPDGHCSEHGSGNPKAAHVCVLNLQKNEIEALTPTKSTFKNQHQHVRGMDLLLSCPNPCPLSMYYKVAFLDISFNKLQSLDGVQQLRSLHSLRASHNCITTLSPLMEVTEENRMFWLRLESLYIVCNTVKEIMSPQEEKCMISMMKGNPSKESKDSESEGKFDGTSISLFSLKSLVFSFNKVSTLPQQLCNIFPRLEELRGDHNQIPTDLIKKSSVNWAHVHIVDFGSNLCDLKSNSDTSCRTAFVAPLHSKADHKAHNHADSNANKGNTDKGKSSGNTQHADPSSSVPLTSNSEGSLVTLGRKAKVVSPCRTVLKGDDVTDTANINYLRQDDGFLFLYFPRFVAKHEELHAKLNYLTMEELYARSVIHFTSIESPLTTLLIDSVPSSLCQMAKAYGCAQNALIEGILHATLKKRKKTLGIEYKNAVGADESRSHVHYRNPTASYHLDGISSSQEQLHQLVDKKKDARGLLEGTESINIFHIFRSSVLQKDVPSYLREGAWAYVAWRRRWSAECEMREINAVNHFCVKSCSEANDRAGRAISSKKNMKELVRRTQYVQPHWAFLYYVCTAVDCVPCSYHNHVTSKAEGRALNLAIVDDEDASIPWSCDLLGYISAQTRQTPMKGIPNSDNRSVDYIRAAGQRIRQRKDTWSKINRELCLN